MYAGCFDKFVILFYLEKIINSIKFIKITHIIVYQLFMCFQNFIILTHFYFNITYLTIFVILFYVFLIKTVFFHTFSQ